MKEEKVTFPPPAQAHIRSLGVQIEGLQTQLQGFIDGLIVGMGVDVLTKNVSVDLADMTATLTAKETPNVGQVE